MKKLIFATAIVFFAVGSRAHAGVSCSTFMGQTTCYGNGQDSGYQSRSNTFMGQTTTTESYAGNGSYQTRTTRCSEFMGQTNCY